MARLKEMLSHSARADKAVVVSSAVIAVETVDTGRLNQMVYDLYGPCPADFRLAADWFQRRSLVN